MVVQRAEICCGQSSYESLSKRVGIFLGKKYSLREAVLTANGVNKELLSN